MNKITYTSYHKTFLDCIIDTVQDYVYCDAALVCIEADRMSEGKFRITRSPIEDNDDPLTNMIRYPGKDGKYTRNKLDFELVGTHAIHVGLITNGPSCELEVRHAFSTASTKLVKVLTGCTFTDFSALVHPTEGCIFNMMFRVAPDSFELEKLVRC